LKIILHNYGGYPYSRQLAENLAKRKHSVHYIYSDTTQVIKRMTHHTEQSNLQIIPIMLSQDFKKYSFLQRHAAEIEHGKKVAFEIKKYQPDVVFSADSPLDAQNYILKACDQRNTKFVFWLQDAIGMATSKILSRKIPIAGTLIGKYYEQLERRLVRQSNLVILNSEDFLPLMIRWRVPDSHLRVIHNWAPLEELLVQPKRNNWSLKMGLANKFCFLYSGILGFKHTPELFIQLAIEFQSFTDVRVVIIAEGEAVQILRQDKENKHLENLILLSYQPAEEFAQVLGAGDVLMTILNSEAGSYSVPSKVLSYMCARRPLLLSIPAENLASRIVLENRAGLVSSPHDLNQWLNNAKSFYVDQNLREVMAENARRYAEINFNIDKITDQFEEIMDACW
jgi:colanic acid biosynthesis glycosyl transferase WcaI